MQKLGRNDLWSLEEYAVRRPAFRTEVITHKKSRQVILGPHASLHFEDRLTMQYQIQEMLRVERIFEAADIQAELDTYNELIPDGSNWKATLLIEYEDANARREALQRLHGIEDRVWVEVQGQSKIYAIANEDLERSNERKTAAVHFLRFEFTAAAIEAIQSGVPTHVGIDNDELNYRIRLSPENQAALVQDFV